MAKPLAIKKMKLPARSIRAMTADHRYALLLLGLFLNEANWLRKLLVKAALAISDDPDGRANFALTALLATTLAGKIHEAWNLITEGKLCKVLDQIGLPGELSELRKKITDQLSGEVFLRIRNNIAFHYPKRKLDFAKLASHLDDSDTVIYMAPEGYAGDVLSQISTLAGIEPLLALYPDADYRVSLKGVWEEVTEVTGLYCVFVCEAVATIILKSVPDLSVEDIMIPDASEADADPPRFFVHPPDDLVEMRVLARSMDSSG
jgi:hypothetical protein